MPLTTNTVTSQTNLNNSRGWEISGTGGARIIITKQLVLCHYLRSSKDPGNSSSRTVLTEEVLRIRRKRTEEAEEALAGGLNKANIFMSFLERNSRDPLSCDNFSDTMS